MSGRGGKRAVLCAALLVALATAGSAGGPVRDFRTFFGIASGAGEVVISPERGFHFTSQRASDVAFAQTSAPLPLTYRVTVNVSHVEAHHSGFRFGIFEGAVRYGGSNDAVNRLSKYTVFFEDVKGQRLIYVWRFDRSDVYSCWDGQQWREKAWVPTGAEWAPQRKYAIILEKTLATFHCEVREDGQTLVAPLPVEIVSSRGAGTPDYLAFGDLVNDYVYGDLSVSSVSIEETAMEPYLTSDLTHVAIRQAPTGRYAMYGGLTKLPDGEVFCVFKVGSIDQNGSPWTIRDETIVWTRSSDHGRTWPQTENLIYQDSTTRQETCCSSGYVSKAGALLGTFDIMNPDYEERAKPENWAKVYLAATRDEGKTWQIRELETPYTIAASYGGFLKLRDGTVLLNVYGAVERGSFRLQSGMLRSRDDGETWGEYTVIGQGADPDGGPAQLNETDVVELPDGRLLSMSRTQYENLPLYRGFSTDAGATWTVGPSELTGLCPALWYTAAGPPEGTVILAYHDRWGPHALKGGVYLSFSHDGGATWGEPTFISGGAYPCLIELEPGTILCSYYQSSSLLRGTIFPVPFPTGLRASGSVPGWNVGIRLEWDRYQGSKAKEYSYRVFRSLEEQVEVNAQNQIGTVQESAWYEDREVEAGRVYYYRVAAYEGKLVGVSWVAAARAGSAEEQE